MFTIIFLLTVFSVPRCQRGYGGAVCGVTTAVSSQLLPVIIPLGILAPLALVLLTVLIYISVRQNRAKKQQTRRKLASDTLSR